MLLSQCHCSLVCVVFRSSQTTCCTDTISRRGLRPSCATWGAPCGRQATAAVTAHIGRHNPRRSHAVCPVTAAGNVPTNVGCAVGLVAPGQPAHPADRPEGCLPQHPAVITTVRGQCTVLCTAQPCRRWTLPQMHDADLRTSSRLCMMRTFAASCYRLQVGGACFVSWPVERGVLLLLLMPARVQATARQSVRL